MKQSFLSALLIFALSLSTIAQNNASGKEDQELIKKVIQSAYVDGLQNEGDMDKIDKGEVVGPRILRSCAIDISKGYGEKMVIRGKPEFWKIADNPQSARDAVRAAVDEGADLIKPMA